MGVLSLMYHRFDENKYPSTNIKMEIFKEHIKIINNLEYEFYDPDKFAKNFLIPKNTTHLPIIIEITLKS